MSNDLEVMKAMASLFKKKAAVMNALEGGMSKKGTNTHFNYKFVTASDIKQTVGRLFAEHGLSLQMSGVATEHAVSVVEKKDFQTKEVTIKEVPILRVQFSISLCDVDTGAVEQSFWFGEAGATDDKAASKCATSALKYFLISNLLIADKDEDKHDTDRDRRKPANAPTSRSESPSIDVSVPTSAPVPHWSTESDALEKMYQWASDTHSISKDKLNAEIARRKQTITDLSKNAVTIMVAALAKKQAS